MITTKETFDQLMENQNQMIDTLSEQTRAFWKEFETDKSYEEFFKEVSDLWMETGKDYLEMFRATDSAEGYEKNLTTAMNKLSDHQADVAEKMMAFFKARQEAFTGEQVTERMNRLGAIYQKGFQTMVDTWSANAKVLQKAFSA